MASKKTRQTVTSMAWTWEDDAPAGAPSTSAQLDVSDQSIEAGKLQVYDDLLSCEPAEQHADAPIERDGDGRGVDDTLVNVLVFADDCRRAAEWLDDRPVSHEDEQARRAGERRRHLKERGILGNGRNYVRICGQIVLDTEIIAAMAARGCIDHWEEIHGSSGTVSVSHNRADQTG